MYIVQESVLRNKPAYLHQQPDNSTVRYKSCPMISQKEGRCDVCKLYRSDLAAVYKRCNVEESPRLRQTPSIWNTQSWPKGFIKHQKQEARWLRKKTSLKEKRNIQKIAGNYLRTNYLYWEDRAMEENMDHRKANFRHSEKLLVVEEFKSRKITSKLNFVVSNQT